jgi:hypothetical protein
MYLSILSAITWFLSGFFFNKAFSAILDFGIVSNIIEKVTRDMLISIVFLEQDMQFVMESKKLILKEKGMSDADIEHHSLIHERNFRLWREKIIVTLINSYPVTYREKFLPFQNWNGAAQYVNEMIKKKVAKQ